MHRIFLNLMSRIRVICIFAIRFILLVFCGFELSGSTNVNNPYADVIKNISYKNICSQNVLDLYYPSSVKEHYPTHIYIHGGGWTSGKKDLEKNVAAVFKQLAKEGFLGVSIEYRFANAKEKRYIRSCVVDCMDALRYLFNQHQELKIDTSNVFVWGDSAGGHLSLLCATAPLNTFPGENPDPHCGIALKGVVAWYPPTDMVHYEEISIVRNEKLRDLSERIGCITEDDPVAFIEISPLAHLTRNDPPVCIFHGDQDRTVNIEHAYSFYQKARKLDVPCQLFVIKNADHCFRNVDGKTIDPSLEFIIDQTSRFFIEQVQIPHTNSCIND